MNATVSRWENQGTVPPASNSDSAAGAGSSRVYYTHAETREHCYRDASWGDHGTGVYGFRCFGDATGCDRWGRDNGKTYPASEF